VKENMEVPQWALDEGFEDSSWHNDAAARMFLTRSPGVNLWVAEERPEDRECSTGKRYTLQVEIDSEANTFLTTDDHAEIIHFLKTPTLEFTVARACAEIWHDMEDGTVPREKIRSFSDLHDYVDANGYGGAFEDWAWRDFDPQPMDMDFWNKVQDQCDKWIKDEFAMQHAIKTTLGEDCKRVLLGEADIVLLIAACEDREGQECYDKLAARLRAVSL